MKANEHGLEVKDGVRTGMRYMNFGKRGRPRKGEERPKFSFEEEVPVLDYEEVA